jgi:flagellar basal-body rod protein FlgB
VHAWPPLLVVSLGFIFADDMIDALLSSASYTSGKFLLDLSAARHELCASNIANLETPGYKRLDFPAGFQSALSRAIRDGGVGSLSLPKPVRDVESPSQRKDGNNVVLQEELLTMSKNSAEYEVVSEFLTSSLKTLRMAIAGHIS